MQYSTRREAVLALVVLSLVLLAFMLLVIPSTISNVSAVEAKGVGVYWDSNCNDRVFSIKWGNRTPGSVKRIIVYIRNEVEESMYLMMSTMNWNPSEASDYIALGWNYARQQIDPGETLQVTLILSVARHIKGITSFSFVIYIAGGDSLPGDVDGNGEVNILDLKKAKLAYSGLLDEPKADVDGDGEISILDLRLLKSILSS